MKTKEIWIVAYIYSIICFCIFFGMKEIESKKLYKQLYQAKSFAVEFHDEKESLYEAVESLNKHIDKMEHLDKLIEEKLKTSKKEMKRLFLRGLVKVDGQITYCESQNVDSQLHQIEVAGQKLVTLAFAFAM